MTSPPGSEGGTRRELAADGGAAIVLIDSITQVVPRDADAVVVTGSHGGVSSGGYASAVRARLYVFNDAGIGKGDAGIAALPLLAAMDIAAVAVGHETARIGEASDTWTCGIISALNEPAGSRGAARGLPLREFAERIAR